MVATTCPACRDGVHGEAGILTYKRVYLCNTDRAAWDVADQHDRAKESAQ